MNWSTASSLLDVYEVVQLCPAPSVSDGARAETKVLPAICLKEHDSG